MANKYLVGSGAFTSTSIWSDTYGGASGATVPVSGDIIQVDTSYNITSGLPSDGSFDFVVYLGNNSPSPVTLGLYGSPTFRSLIIQSKNSAAHTVMFGGNMDNITAEKYIFIGSSASNRLTLEGGAEGSYINSTVGGSMYGQYVDMSYSLYPGNKNGTPFYIGSNSTAIFPQDWILQDPPKISTLVDPLTTAPGSNTNWTAPTYSGAGLPTLTNTGYEGGGYDFGNKDGVVSTNTYDLLDSDFIVELTYQARSGSNNFSLYAGFLPGDGSNSAIYSGLKMNVISSGSNVGYSAFSQPLYGFAEGMIYTTSFSAGRRFIKFRIDSSTGLVSCSESSDGISWSGPASAATPLSETNLAILRSSRVVMTAQYNGSGTTYTTIGSINPALAPRTPVEVPGIGGGFGAASGYAGTGYGESMRLASVEVAIALDNAIHSLSSSNIALSQAHLIAATNALHAHTASSPAMTQNHMISVDSASSSLTSGNLLLVENYLLAAQAALHTVASGQIPLSQAGSIAVQNALHGVTSAQLALQHLHILGVQNGNISHTVESLSLIESYALQVQQAVHSVFSDNITLSGAGYLSIQNAIHGIFSAELALTQAHSLAVSSSSISHTVSSVSLVQHYLLSVGNALHTLYSGNLNLTGQAFLTVEGALHTLLSPELTTSQLHTLLVDNTHSGLSSDNVSLLEAKTLALSNAIHVLNSPEIFVSQATTLGVQNASSSVSSQQLALLQLQLMSVQNSLHGLSSEAIALLEYTLLNKPSNSTHTLSSSLLNLSQQTSLELQNALHLIFSKDLQKIVDWTVLGVDFGRYSESYRQPGSIEQGTIDTGRLREGYSDSGFLEAVDPASAGRYREDYKQTGKY